MLALKILLAGEVQACFQIKFIPTESRLISGYDLEKWVWKSLQDIEILQNGIPIGQFASGFTETEICIALSLVDITHDVFELKPIGNNGVCITGSKYSQ